ncbi:outer membrane beta-barrel family protein [Pedobacter gandavensis]|nr:outer membrane beta-barrel family protein [Pedobacter gandavensis]
MQYSLRTTISSVAVLLFLAISLSISAQNTFSGTIKGRVLDEHKATLPFASIFLKLENDSVIYKSQIGAENGDFSFTQVKAGKYLLEIKVMGYGDFKKSGLMMSQNSPLTDLGMIQLFPNSKVLTGVTITGRIPLFERRADKMIINLDQNLQSSPSMMEVMNKLPGVQVNPVDDQISLNGRGVQIYIDGKATPLSSDALAGLLKGMSPSGIQKIELIANPSAKYDAAGGAGIINIIRKRNYKGGLNGNVFANIGQGTYGKQVGGLNLNYKGDGFNVLLNTNYNYNKYNFDTKVMTDFFDQNGFLTAQTGSDIKSVRSTRIYTPTLGLDFYLSKKTTLSFTTVQNIQRFHKDARSSPLIADQTEEKDLFLNLVKAKTLNSSYSMHFLRQIDTLGKELTADLDFYNYDNQTGNDNTSLSAQEEVSALKSFLDQGRKYKVYAAKIDYTQPLGSKRRIELGLKTSFVRSDNENRFFITQTGLQILDPSQSDRFKYTEMINAIYTTFSKDGTHFSYQIGLRGEHTLGKGLLFETSEHNNRRYFQLFPSLYFDYKFNEKHSLNLNLNKNINRPTYENLNPLIRILDANNFLQGNPELKPGIVYNAALTYNLKNAFFATVAYGYTKNDFTSFSRKFENTEITSTKPENNKYTQYFSSHVAYNKQVNSWWYTSTGINYNQRTYKSVFDGYELQSSGIPGFGASSYDAFSVTKKFSFLVLLRYTGKFQERNLIYDPSFTFTAGVSQKLFKNKGTLALNVTDIFETYKSRYTQNSGAINQVWENKLETRIGRLSFSYNFGGAIKSRATKNAAEEESQRTKSAEN